MVHIMQTHYDILSKISAINRTVGSERHHEFHVKAGFSLSIKNVTPNTIILKKDVSV